MYKIFMVFMMLVFSSVYSKDTYTVKELAGELNNKDYIVYGDSIAYGLASTLKLSKLYTKVGNSPSRVYSLLIKDTRDISDATVYLSSGLSNATYDLAKQRKIIVKQIRYLKNKGADIQLLGVAYNFKGNYRLGRKLNSILHGIAKEEDIIFLKGFRGVDSMRVHPKYSKLKIKK